MTKTETNKLNFQLVAQVPSWVPDGYEEGVSGAYLPYRAHVTALYACLVAALDAPRDTPVREVAELLGWVIVMGRALRPEDRGELLAAVGQTAAILGIGR